MSIPHHRRHGSDAASRFPGARAALVALVLAGLGAAAPPAGALTLPAGFQQTTAITGLNEPMDVEVAPGGRVFVAEKSGRVLTYDTIADPTPHVFADLRTQVHNYSSRGLESLALDPDYPDEPYVYVYYVLDAPIGGTAPTFGSPGATTDPCPGDTDDVNCLVSVRVSRLRAEGENVSGPEQVLVNDWCQQFQFHPGGGMDFGVDGNLYVSGGDGARWEIFDYGQLGHPPNPCGDPPGNAPGTVLTPPTAEGGRLRSQDLRTRSDPLGLNGSLIRIDPDTGAGVIGNPLFADSEPNARRMLAHGFRNAVALAVRPGTNDTWVADRGGGYFEELDRVPDPSDPVRNFGWPCYEGGMDANGNPYPRIRPRSDDQDLDICEDLYDEVTATSAPFWAYDHEKPVVPGEDCAVSQSSGKPAGNQISGLAFYPASGSFPPPFRRALFFGDRLRSCIWAMLAGPDGVPDRGQVVPFAQQAGDPFTIEMLPGGDMLYVDHATDRVQRISYPGGTPNQPPTAVAQADATTGNTPLTVNFDASGSSDPDTPAGDVLAYEWDLDGDGGLDDSTAAAPTFTYTAAGTYTVTLRVTDTAGATDTDTLTIEATTGPSAWIDSPAASTTWGAGQAISFSGGAMDASGTPVPADGLDWTVTLDGQAIGDFADAAAGSFTAPDQAQPGQIEVRLTVTYPDSTTAVRTVSLAPRTVNLALSATPSGAAVTLNGASVPTPATVPVVSGSSNSLAAPASQSIGGRTYRFSSWDDGQAGATRTFTATANRSFAATFAPVEPGTHTVAFAPEADARVDAAQPGTNLGTDTQLRTDAASGSQETEQSFLRFQVAGISGRVTQAKLRLRSITNTANGPAVRGTTNTWSETGVTWSNRPAPTTAVTSDAGAIGTDAWQEWDVTPLLAGDGTLNLHLAQPGTDGIFFHSRESSSTSFRPQLVVTFTNDAYARPKSASPVQMPLVPAYEPCTAPNREHGPPLAQPSCNPPQPASSAVTVGTPDTNGLAANSTGFARYAVIAGDAATPGDEADVALSAEVSDVRVGGGALLDYAGELGLRAAMKLTDRGSGATGAEPATLEALELPVTMPCTPTLGLQGSTCSVSTTLDAMLPGAVREGTRAVWELGRIEITDGGPDGDADTPGNAPFMRQGLFVP